MATRTLEITFVGDAKPVTKAFSDVEDSGGRLTAKLGGLSSAFGTVASTAAGFLAANVIAKAPGFLIDAAKAAAEDEAATDRLKQALQNLGGDFDAHLAQVNAAIAAGQKLAFSDDEIRDSFQFLAAATGDTEEALKRQKAAMDLARGANIPLAQATKMLGKLNEENVEVLRKLGITLGENATEADALAAVQAKFGGQADAYAKSTAGQFAQAKIAMGEIVEGIGGAVLPIMAKLGTALAAHLPAIQAFVGELGEKVASVVAPAFGLYARVLSQTLPVVVDLATAAGERLLPPLRELAESVGSALVATWKQNLVPAFQLARQAFEALAPLAKEVAQWMRELASAIADRLAGPLTAVFGFLSSHRDELKIFAAALAVAVPVVYAIAAAHMAQAAAATAAAAAEGVALLPVLAISVALAALVVGIVLVVKHWDDITAKFPALGTAASAVKTALDAFTSWITGTFVPKTLAIYNAIKDAVDKAVKYVSDHWDDIKAIIEPALQALGVIIETHWALFKTAIETALGVIKGLVDVFMGIFTGDWDRAWGGVRKIFESLWEGLKATVQIAIDALSDLLPIIGAAGEALGKALVSAIWAGLGDLWKLGADIVHWVLQGIMDMASSLTQYVTNLAGEIASKLNPKNILSGLGSSVLGQSAGEGGGGAAPLSTGGGMGQASSSYVDPRGYTYTADEILNMRDNPVAPIVINIGTANMTNQAEANRTLTSALRAAGLA